MIQLDKFYGLSVLLLGHDLHNFNIDMNNSKHIYMEFDARGGYTDVKTWEKFSGKGIGEWVHGYHPKSKDFTKEQKAAVESFGQFINGSLVKLQSLFRLICGKRKKQNGNLKDVHL